RVIDARTAELYQKPTPNWGLESCQRFRLLDDGVIEMTVECVPRKAGAFRNGYVGLFWASYIDKPESTAVHFLGRGVDDPKDAPPRWIDATSRAHGVDATHPPAHAPPPRRLSHVRQFQRVPLPVRRAVVFRRVARHGLRAALPPRRRRPLRPIPQRGRQRQPRLGLPPLPPLPQ